MLNPAAGCGSTLFVFPADPFVITRIQIACVDESGPVVVMSGVLRFEIFRMTRSITHVIKFSIKQTSGRHGTQLIRSGVVELLGYTPDPPLREPHVKSLEPTFLCQVAKR